MSRLPVNTLIFFGMAAALGLLVGGGLLAAGDRVAEGEVSQHQLPNGMKLVVVEDTRFPLVAIELVISGGSAAELPTERGAAHRAALLLLHSAQKALAVDG